MDGDQNSKTSIYEYASLPFVAGIEPIAPPLEPDMMKKVAAYIVPM